MPVTEHDPPAVVGVKEQVSDVSVMDEGVEPTRSVAVTVIDCVCCVKTFSVVAVHCVGTHVSTEFGKAESLALVVELFTE